MGLFVAQRGRHQPLLERRQRPLLRGGLLGAHFHLGLRRLSREIAAREATNALREDFEIADAPPFAIGNRIDAGRFLQRYGERDRAVEGRIELGFRQAVLLVRDERIQ